MHTTAQRNITNDSSPAFTAGRKIGVTEIVQIWESARQNPACPTPQIRNGQETLPISDRQVNRYRCKWGLNRHKGRPNGSKSTAKPIASREVIHIEAHLSFVGVHVFFHWIEQQGIFPAVMRLLLLAIHEYCEMKPEEDFALLHHKKETLLRLFQALFYAPLLGIGKLSEFDYKENPMASLIGQSYQSSTLSQFLGQLERIDAGPALMPTLLPAESGKYCYIDGHMIAFWSRVSMHKGKITMLGRIMAGSEAVIAHNENGVALRVEYYPPDQHLSHVIIEYCQHIMATTETKIFVIDREINSVEIARTFENKEWGLLSMLDANEYEGLESFDAQPVGQLPDGSQVYQGQWKNPRPEDPRQFVIVVEPERVLVFWGTSKVLASLPYLEWPQVYRDRNEIQEKSFKRMIAHEALNVNYGIKKIEWPDRHQQRAKEAVEKSIEVISGRVEKTVKYVDQQRKKVLESKEHEHGIRLVQRENKLRIKEEKLQKLTQKHAALVAKHNDLGKPKTRFDRDFRKQTIMTVRSLLLDNALMAFVAMLCGKLDEPVTVESLLNLLFGRSGSRVEKTAEIIYRINTQGLSLKNYQELSRMVVGINALELKYTGKIVRLRLQKSPT